MKLMRTPGFVMIGLMVQFSWVAFPQSSAPKSKAGSPRIPKSTPISASVPGTDDIEALVRQLVALGSGKKGEFETTAQFDARQSSIQTGKQYALVYVWDAFNNRSDCEYDADKRIMTVNMQIERKGFRPEYDPVLSVLIKCVLRRTEHHVGQNSFGARAIVESRFEDDFGIVISEEAASWLQTFSSLSQEEAKLKADEIKLLQKMYPEAHSPAFSFPLSIEKAKYMKPSLRIVLVGTVPNARVYRDESFDAATVSAPVEITVNRFYVKFIVKEVRIVDSRTGSALIQENGLNAEWHFAQTHP